MTLSAQVELGDSSGGINMHTVGEEMEGIVMLSLLKQKMENLAKSPRVVLSDDEEEEEASYSSIRLKRTPEALGSPSIKRIRGSPEQSSAWMDMFSLAKRNMTGRSIREADAEVQDWIVRQTDMTTRGLLSQERVELLRMIGIELPSPQTLESPSHSEDDSRNSEDDFEDDNNASDVLNQMDNQRSLRSRGRSSSTLSTSVSAPPGLMLGANFRDDARSRGKRVSSGKKKANLKRNSLHNWVYNQRRLQYEGNLPTHRKKLLDKIGFDWKWVQQKIDEQAAQQGGAPPPEPKMDEDAEGIPSSKSEELWMKRYRELIAFKQVHGHYEVPRYVE